MPRKPIVAVIGAGRDIQPAIANARELGRLIAGNGWILITGGRDAGVMRAANEGAKEIDGSLTIGILPNATEKISPAVDVAVVTDTGHARNNIIVLTADIVIACGVDGPGTTSEVALALKNGKPVILVGANEETRRFFIRMRGGLHFADNASEAIEIALRLREESSLRH